MYGQSQQANMILKNSIETPAHIIQIKNDFFYPCFLKIERNSVVEWRVSVDNMEQNENSLFFFASRSHVISFSNLNAETKPLTKNSDGFKVRFLEPGVYNFRCQIYTRMRGRIEVVDHRPNKVQIVKSVKEVSKLINLAATPAPK